MRVFGCLLALLALGCGGGVPLMHAAHPMKEGDVTIGAGFSGKVPIAPSRLSDETDDRIVEEGAFAPGLAPWVGGRVGLDGAFDAGLAYTGRTVRVDARRAFDFDGPAISVGLGASGILPKRRDDPGIAGEELGYRIGGFGGDLPFLVGYQSSAEIYAAWLGIRGGAEVLRGSRDLPPDPAHPEILGSEDISGWHAWAGGLLGVRIGFRYVFAVFELDGAMHWAGGKIGDRQVTVSQFALAPAGAIVGKF